MADFENAKDKVVGQAKEAYGEATDNDKVANEGKGEQTAADAKDKLSDAANNIKDKASEALGKLTGDDK